MPPPPVRLIILSGQRHERRARALAALLAPGCEGCPVARLSSSPPELLPDHCDAVMILRDPDEPAHGLTSVLEAAAQRHLPVMFLSSKAPAAPLDADGVIHEHTDADPRLLEALLRGMMARQSEIMRLRGELSISTRFTGGLRSEISRMQDELQLAADVQREFLPRALPSVGGLRVAGLWRPAGYVSGDIYNAMRLDEDHLGVFIADAVGHGVPAALLTMVICRSFPIKEIRGQSYRLLAPSEALARINSDMISRQGRATRFATAAYAIINWRTLRTRMSIAGHPAPIILRGDDQVEFVTERGGLLGIFEEETYPEVELQLEEGDRLLLYSDGFEQAFPDPEEAFDTLRLPTRRYVAEFTACRDAREPQHFIDAVSRRLDAHLGSLHQADDLTLLAIAAGAPTDAAKPEGEHSR